MSICLHMTSDCIMGVTRAGLILGARPELPRGRWTATHTWGNLGGVAMACVCNSPPPPTGLLEGSL